MDLTPSSIGIRDRLSEGEVNGRWVIEARECQDHPAGTMVADAAPGEPDDLTFTAANGKRYWDVPSHVRWTPRGLCTCGPVRHWECNAGCKARA